jgi:hypothetical protein
MPAQTRSILDITRTLSELLTVPIFIILNRATVANEISSRVALSGVDSGQKRFLWSCPGPSPTVLLG